MVVWWVRSTWQGKVIHLTADFNLLLKICIILTRAHIRLVVLYGLAGFSWETGQVHICLFGHLANHKLVCGHVIGFCSRAGKMNYLSTGDYRRFRATWWSELNIIDGYLRETFLCIWQNAIFAVHISLHNSVQALRFEWVLLVQTVCFLCQDADST